MRDLRCRIYCVSMIIITLLCFTGCKNEEKVEQQFDNTLTQYQTEYVGDNTKVIQITSKQTYPTGYSYDHIEIQSRETPYGLIVYLKVEEVSDTAKEELKENADVTFELIGNLDIIKYVDTATAEEIISFDRKAKE